MTKAVRAIPAKLRQYWRKVMDSTKNKMNFGASCLNKIICRAHGDQWRGRDKNHKKG